MALSTFVNVGDQPVGVDDLGAWIARCEAHQAELTALSDDNEVWIAVPNRRQFN